MRTSSRARPRALRTGSTTEQIDHQATGVDGNHTARRASAVCPGCAARHRVEDAAAGSELMRRRYPPTGDRELWVRYGEAGRPECEGVDR